MQQQGCTTAVTGGRAQVTGGLKRALGGGRISALFRFPFWECRGEIQCSAAALSWYCSCDLGRTRTPRVQNRGSSDVYHSGLQSVGKGKSFLSRGGIKSEVCDSWFGAQSALTGVVFTAGVAFPSHPALSARRRHVSAAGSTPPVLHCTKGLTYLQLEAIPATPSHVPTPQELSKQHCS